MIRNTGLKMGRGMLPVCILLIGLAFCLLPLSQAFGYTQLVIDDMEIEFGNAAFPAVQRTSPGTAVAAQTGQNPNKIIGGARVLEVTMTGGPTSTDGFIDSTSDPTKRSWKVTNGTSTFGGGRIVWSGSANINDCTTFNLNWSNLHSLECDNLTTDHTTTFHVTLFSQGGGSSTVNQLVTGGVVFPALQITKNMFLAAGNVDLSHVCRIQISVDASVEAAMDTGLIHVWANFGQAVIRCTSKQWTTDSGYNNLQQALTLPSGQAFPVTLYAQLTATNSGDGNDTVYIEDVLDPVMTKSGPTVVVSPAGFVLGESSGNTGTINWTSTTKLKPGEQLIFRFPISVSTFTGTKQNSFRARGGTETQFSGSSCPSTVTIGAPPPRVPAMNEWGAMIAFVLICLGGLYLARRKRSA